MTSNGNLWYSASVNWGANEYESDDWLERDCSRSAEGDRKHSQAKGSGHDDTLQNAEISAVGGTSLLGILSADIVPLTLRRHKAYIVLCPFLL